MSCYLRHITCRKQRIQLVALLSLEQVCTPDFKFLTKRFWAYRNCPSRYLGEPLWPMNTFSYLHDGDGPICDTSPVERSHAHSTGNNGAQSAHLATSFEFAGTTLTHQLVQGIQKSKKWRRGRKLSENHVNFKDSMCEWRPV